MVFGGLTYVAIIPQHIFKFSHHVKPYVFVGYWSGFKLIDVKFIISRDVILQEIVFKY